MPPHYPNNPTVLNVAEKPSVARALASVFARLPGAQDRGMRREAAQIFTHENVQFPSVFAQGEGRLIQGPSKCVCVCPQTNRPPQLSGEELWLAIT